MARGIVATASGSSRAAARELLPTVTADGDRTADYAQGGRSLGAEARRHALPTVTIHGNHNAAGASAKSGDGLATVARRQTPTVVASDFKGSSVVGQRPTTLSEAAAGQTLSARFCEWHMGAPVGWGDLAPLPDGELAAWELAAREGRLWDTPPPMTCVKGAEPRRAARIRQAGNAWVPLCAWVAFGLLAQDLEVTP